MILPENTVILDLETQFSADDCRHCGAALDQHYADGACADWSGERPADDVTQFSAIGWNNKPALGLSMGCYWDDADSRIHWFDPPTLEATVRHFVERQPLLVSFNGISFDFVLMRGLLRRQDEVERLALQAAMGVELETTTAITQLCDTFKLQCASSYDLLAEIWRADPASKRVKGLNSLDTIAQANGLGAKLSHGAQAPRDWAAGRHASVLNYCQDDVYKTKALFEKVVTDGYVMRGDGQKLALPRPPGFDAPVEAAAPTGPGPLRQSPLSVLAQYPGNAAREEAAALAETMKSPDHEPEPKGSLV